MSPGLLGFKRLVLGLQAGAPSRATRLAVEFAELFDAELLGLLIDDAGLRHLAGIPLAHAFSSLGAGWRRLELAQALDEADYAASRAELLFTEAARRLARRRFEIVRGGAAHALAAIWRSDDLVLIEAPAAPAERAAEPFASLFSAALDSAAAVMLTPARLSRSAGSIVAIAAGGGTIRASRRRPRSQPLPAKNSSSSKSARAPAPPCMLSAAPGQRARVFFKPLRRRLLTPPTRRRRLCGD